MVSKLQLAVQECCLKATEDKESPEVIGRLLEHYYEINAGIGVHKSPALYGAFPTDPYSHTPAGKGAQQPGMTGQVKEDILSRFGELGVFVKNGSLYFNPCLLRKDEFLSNSKPFNYVDVHFNHKAIELEKNSLGFTYCQIPVVYKIGNTNSVAIVYNDATVINLDALNLGAKISQQVFGRSAEINQIRVTVLESELK